MNLSMMRNKVLIMKLKEFLRSVFRLQFVSPCLLGVAIRKPLYRQIYPIRNPIQERFPYQLMYRLSGWKKQVITSRLGQSAFDFAMDCAKIIYVYCEVQLSDNYNATRDHYMYEKVEWFLQHGDNTVLFINYPITCDTLYFDGIDFTGGFFLKLKLPTPPA